MTRAVLVALLLVPAARAADPSPYKDVNPSVFPPDDPRAKELPRMVAADQKRRMQEASLRESKTFAAVTTRAQWEAFRDARIKALRESLGTFPEPPKDMRVKTTRTLDGDGFRIHNLVYESRPGLWVSANLYLPATPPAKMPGVLISHAHHTAKTHGELQDMGMTWARAGVAVLVPDHLGHGERRQHDFATEKDYPKPFRVGRQDYYFRYNSNLQLSLIGDSLMGWMVWDLMRGVDVLLKQPTIDRGRIILLGAVAGGGDPAGVTAALDRRISCVVPFNFGGWQPESSATANPDRDFAWFGEGYWESTRGLRGGAKGGFAHWVIVGSVAPRPVVYAHEFAWDAATDPAWPRLQKVFGFYGAKDKLAMAHGSGSVRGQGPENTHCTHIGAVHRKGIYPALEKWFGMPIPTEYSNRRPAADLLCWTDAARAESKPRKLHELLGDVTDEQVKATRQRLSALNGELFRSILQTEWTGRLGNFNQPRILTLKAHDEAVAGGVLHRTLVETESGILQGGLFVPSKPRPDRPLVVVLASAGSEAFFKERGDAIAAFLKAGVLVYTMEVRATGASRPGTGAPTRGSSRTTASQTEVVLGQPLTAAQLSDHWRLWAVALTLVVPRDGGRLGPVAVWGDSFAPVNPPDRRTAVPFDVDTPAIAEPGGATLALLAAVFDERVKVVYARGGLSDTRSLLASPYLAVPHDAVIPGGVALTELPAQLTRCGVAVRYEGTVDGQNRAVGDKPMTPTEAAAWIIGRLTGKGV